MKNIFLDVGAKDKKEVEKMGIHVGCVVTYEDTFMVLNKDWYVARALDNRAGGFMIAEVARLLHEEGQVAVWPHITNSVQEGWIARGANDRGADFTGRGHRNRRNPLHPHADDE